MFFRLCIAVAVAASFAGCTTYSSPTQNTDIVTLANGTQAYRVQCMGLMESSQSCMDQVKKICGDKNAVRISSVDRAASGFKPENDPREITFVCETPVVQQAPAPVQPQPAVVAAPVVAAPVVRKVTLQGDANFAVGSATLTPAAIASLDGFVAANRGVDIDLLTIAGYTDSTGSAALNDRLSAARARSVQSYLASAGVRASKYDVQGFGSASPVASNATSMGRAKNRRVEVQVDGK